jgi:TolB-like protein/DNA-binding SARP family transcriptional activator/Flp pilus assembly protein TadD
MASTIRLRTLGSLQLHDATGEEVRSLLAQPRRIALLVYLAVAAPRGFHRRDTLLALFWPDHDEQRARNALSQAIHFLRRVLGAEAIISRGDDELGANAELLWCDAVAFEVAGGTGHLDEALELYRGPFLDGFHVSSAAAELDRWVDTERARLTQRYAQALDRMADAREAVGDSAGAAVWLRKLVASDPYGARATLRLMRSLAAAGDSTGAIQHARVHEALVREELGAAVDPGVAALVRTLQTAPQVEAVNLERTSSPAASITAPTEASVAAAATPLTSTSRGWGRRSSAIALGAVGVVAVGALALPRVRGASSLPPPPIHCLAVLPLENLNRDSTQEYFADGVTDAIITELARHEQLNVISRTSVMRYKRTTKPLPTIGRELNCDGLMEGTISIRGNHVHVNAQLLYAPDDRHLWAKGYDGELGDVLAIERQIADSIVSQVHGVTTPLQHAAAPKVDPVTYGQYLRGRDAFRSRNPASLRQAIALFKQTTARDSTFALGYAGLADAYRFLGGLGYAPRAPLSDSARLMAARALALDSTLSEPHTSLAALLTDDGEWARADAEFRRAITLQPGNSLAHHWYAILLATLDRKDEAVREIRRAEELDPLSQPIRGAKIDIERFAGVSAAPVSPVRAALVDPTHPGTLASRSVNLARRGRCPEAYAENGRAQELAPDNTTMMISLVGVHMLCGRAAEGRALLDSVERRPDARAVGTLIAELFAAANKPDSAFAWLERTEWRMQARYNLRVSPRLASLRSDARYPLLLARMGLH